VELHTERLILREYDPDDFDAVHAYASDPRVATFVEWGPNQPEDTR
jgi:[ribosomal protein S5]-alanine N-acetyltransferase